MLIRSRLLRPCKVKVSNKTAIEATKGTITITIITTTTEDEVETEVAATIIETTNITTKRMLNTSNDLNKSNHSMGTSMINNNHNNIKTIKETIEAGNVVGEEVKTNNEMQVRTHS